MRRICLDCKDVLTEGDGPDDDVAYILCPVCSEERKRIEEEIKNEYL